MVNNWMQNVISNVKNLIGWKTDRKIVVISVDDYGNVRLDSKEARQNMEKNGITVKSYFSGFDMYDSLETKADLEMLFNTLSLVKDKNGSHAVFTPFAVPCNINFEKMEELDYREYVYELLPSTYSKLATSQPNAYKGTWELWKEGIREGFLVPQFHGREHFNLKVFKEKLKKNEDELILSLKNRSLARNTSEEYTTISFSAAFDFWEFEENQRFNEIIEDGLNAFEEVFGYRSVHFNPPGGREHPVIHEALKESGIRYIDTPLIKREHQGSGSYKKKFNYTGKTNEYGQIYIVRNVVFEPTQERGINWVNFAIKQIEAAFRWNRPAIISSHRVNFCGHINEENRRKGLQALKELLKEITERWPEVEFMAANELGDLIKDDMEHG